MVGIIEPDPVPQYGNFNLIGMFPDCCVRCTVHFSVRLVNPEQRCGFAYVDDPLLSSG